MNTIQAISEKWPLLSQRFVELRLSDGQVLTVSRYWWKCFLRDLDEEPSSEQALERAARRISASMELKRIEVARKTVLAALTKARAKARMEAMHGT